MTLGVSPLAKTPKLCESAVWQTCTSPAITASIAETSGWETDHSASSPSSFRKPPDMVEISGE